jgi:hypothetical protein
MRYQDSLFNILHAIDLSPSGRLLFPLSFKNIDMCTFTDTPFFLGILLSVSQNIVLLSLLSAEHQVCLFLGLLFFASPIILLNRHGCDLLFIFIPHPDKHTRC